MLLLQGNWDVLFNLIDVYWNWVYFWDVVNDGVLVLILFIEGGYMNLLVNQIEGSVNCGNLVGIDLILSWFDFYLKGEDFGSYQSILMVCIFVVDIQNVYIVILVGLVFEVFLVGF